MEIIFIVIIGVIACIAGVFIQPIVDKLLKYKYDMRAKNWNDKHALYLDFVAEHDGEQPRQGLSNKISNEEDAAAGWANAQRLAYTHGLMTREHYEILRAEGFNFENKTSLKDSESFKPEVEDRTKFSYENSIKNRILPALAMVIGSVIPAVACYLAILYPEGLISTGIDVTQANLYVFGIFNLALMFALVIASICDARAFILPYELTRNIILPLSVVFTIVAFGLNGIINALCVVVIDLLFYFIITTAMKWILKKKYSVGGGDIMLLFPISIIAGAPSAFNFSLVILGWAVFQGIGAVISAVVKKQKINSSMAAGPYLTASYVAAISIPFVIPMFESMAKLFLP